MRPNIGCTPLDELEVRDRRLGDAITLHLRAPRRHARSSAGEEGTAKGDGSIYGRWYAVSSAQPGSSSINRSVPERRPRDVNRSVPGFAGLGAEHKMGPPEGGAHEQKRNAG